MYISRSIGIATTTALLLSTSTLDTVPDLQGSTLLRLADGGESPLQRWSSLIGITTAIIGNILISFALNIQRYAHIRLHREEEERKTLSRISSKAKLNGYGTADSNHESGDTTDSKNPNHDDSQPFGDGNTTGSKDLSPNGDDEQSTSYLKSPYWWAGILLMTIGETGNFLAYGFAPASIVSPLGVVALVSNCVIAPIMLKERFRWRDLFGVVVAVGGAVTVVLSAKQQEKKLGPHEVIGAITRTEFEVYMGITIGMILILMWLSPKYGSKTILVDLGLVALFGGYTALSTKGVASMLSFTLWKAFTTPITYALVGVLAGTAVMQVRYINRALQRFDSTQVIPVQFVLFTISVIIGSAILYRDFESATVESVSKFVGGCFLTFFGVFLITSGRDNDSDSNFDQDSDAEVEETAALSTEDQDDLLSQTSTIRRREHEDPGHSRSSSKVSFVRPSPLSRPQTPRINSYASQPPSLHLTRSHSRSDDVTPLLPNPWKEATDERFASARAHPGMPSTTSSPQLAADARLNSAPGMNLNPSDALRPGSTSRSQSHAQSYLHPVYQEDGHVHLDPHSAQRPATLRHSLSRSMLPGPYFSPLSSSLSAVVADTARRGPHARPRLHLRRSKSGSHRYESEDPTARLGASPTKDGAPASVGRSYGSWMGRNSNSNSNSAHDRRASAEEGGGEVSVQKRWSRTRSMSNTLSDFWKGRKQSRDDEDEEQGEEGVGRAGPSGS